MPEAPWRGQEAIDLMEKCCDGYVELRGMSCIEVSQSLISRVVVLQSLQRTSEITALCDEFDQKIYEAGAKGVDVRKAKQAVEKARGAAT